MKLNKTECLLIIGIAFGFWLGVSSGLQVASAQEEFPGIDDLNPEQIREISISPMATSKPALRYKLHDDRLNVSNRNAAIHYHRAFEIFRSVDSGILLQNSRRPDLKLANLYDNYEEWMSSSLDKMPKENMQTWIDRYGVVIEELGRARDSSYCDWQILPSVAEEKSMVWSMRMDEIQGMRSMTRMIVIAIRLKLAEGKFDDAIGLMNLGYTMAKDTEKSEVLIGCLVGVACVGHLQEPLTLLIQLEDAPNLYWPLLDLPHPVVSMRKAIRNELAIYSDTAGAKFLEDPENASLSSEGWRQLFLDDFRSLQGLRGREANQENLFMTEIRIHNNALVLYPKAKQFLLNEGIDSDIVDKMPVLQVVASHQKRLMAEIHDDIQKYLNLPIPDLVESVNRVQEELQQGEVGVFGVPRDMNPYLEANLPAFQQVIYAEARTYRQLTALRVIEAIRAHAAETGTLPKSLDEISVVPVPVNPVTNEPFPYRLQGDTAELFDFGIMDFSRILYRISLRK